jgi:hypothetical protein
MRSALLEEINQELFRDFILLGYDETDLLEGNINNYEINTDNLYRYKYFSNKVIKDIGRSRQQTKFYKVPLNEQGSYIIRKKANYVESEACIRKRAKIEDDDDDEVDDDYVESEACIRKRAKIEDDDDDEVAENTPSQQKKKSVDDDDVELSNEDAEEDEDSFVREPTKIELETYQGDVERIIGKDLLSLICKQAQAHKHTENFQSYLVVNRLKLLFLALRLFQYFDLRFALGN